MTIQVDTTGPGTEAYRSTRFACAVDGGAAAYVHGYSRVAVVPSTVWAVNDTVEQSVMRYGTDASTSLAVTLVSGDPITAATVYPKDAGVTQVISGGVLTLKIPAHVKLRVEVNDDRANVLSVLANPLTTTPNSTVDYSTLAKGIVSIAGTLIEVTAHGYVNGAKVLLKSSGALPSVSTGILSEYEVLTVSYTSANSFELVDANGITIAFEAIADTSDLSITTAEWSDTTNTLLIPSGVTNIGRHFRMHDGAEVFLHASSVVIGSFQLNCNEALVHGPGFIYATYATPEYVAGLSGIARWSHAVFYCEADGLNISYSNTVTDVTVVAQPLFLSFGGVRRFQDCSYISPWSYSTDGFAPQTWAAETVTANISQVIDCYGLGGDDAVRINIKKRSFECSGTFVTTTNNSCFSSDTRNDEVDPAMYYLGTNNHAMHLGPADDNADRIATKTIFKLLTDSGDPNGGHQNYTWNGLKVWGPVASRIFVLGNLPNPFFPTQGQLGQVRDLLVMRLVVEEVPGQVSFIQSLDATNTPHDLKFQDMTVAGVEVTEDSFSTYIAVDAEVYNLTFVQTPSGGGGGIVTPPGTTFVVEDGSRLADANTFASVEFADSYFVNLGNPVGWSSASTLTKQNGLRQAAEYLQNVYGSRWRGTQATSTQGLPWPRVGVTDGDTGYVYTSVVIPRSLKQAACEVALRVAAGVTLRPDIDPGDGNITSSTMSVGGISITEDFVGAATTAPVFPVVKQLLRSLLTDAGSAMMHRVTR